VQGTRDEARGALRTIALHMAKLVLATLAAGILAVSAYFILQPHRPATDALVTTLDGRIVPISEFKGRVVAVNFWATWCGSCLREMPKLAEAYRKYSPRGYEMVAVAVRDRPDAVAEYAKRKSLPFPVALDAGEAARRFGNVRITPTTYLLDRHGRVVKRFVGEPDWNEYEAAVERALAR
jgi:thiol-disulfide isomerase/thioredoxin